MNGLRDVWLSNGVDALRPMFTHYGHSLPGTIHTSIGFPSKGGLGRTKRVLGQCWDADASKDGNCHIFINPTLTTPVEILDTLTHELVHVVTPKAKHKGQFIHVSKLIGLTKGKPTSASAGPELLAKLEGIAEKLGALPHSALSPNLGLPKQSTRMIKCECPGCGYTARTTRKWLEVGPPFCPQCACPCEPDETIDRLNAGDSMTRSHQQGGPGL